MVRISPVIGVGFRVVRVDRLIVAMECYEA
jgi:hypothetical protein